LRPQFQWQGVWYKGKHELIIPPALVAAVQNIRGEFKAIARDQEHGIFGGGYRENMQSTLELARNANLYTKADLHTKSAFS